jgi:hypothetical protein
MKPDLRDYKEIGRFDRVDRAYCRDSADRTFPMIFNIIPRGHFCQSAFLVLRPQQIPRVKTALSCGLGDHVGSKSAECL